MDPILIVPLWVFLFTNAEGAEELSVNHSEFGCAAVRSYHEREGLDPGECVKMSDDLSQKFQYIKRTK